MTNLEIIIPVYNEGNLINKVYERLCLAITDEIKWKLKIIYDFDEDTTLPFIKKIEEKDERVSSYKQNYGKGVINALKYGFSLVHDGAVAVVMGDNSDHLEMIPIMLKSLEENDAYVVASSRHSSGGKYIGGTFVKKNLSLIAGKILKFFGVGTSDPTNNFKLYNGSFLKKNLLESIAGFEIALELTVKAALQGKKVYEVPGTWEDRSGGTSKFQLFKWLPHYLKWFLYYFRHKFFSLSINQ